MQKGKPTHGQRKIDTLETNNEVVYSCTESSMRFHTQMLPYLESLGHSCPLYMNPADFILRLASSKVRLYAGDERKKDWWSLMISSHDTTITGCGQQCLPEAGHSTYADKLRHLQQTHNGAYKCYRQERDAPGTRRDVRTKTTTNANLEKRQATQAYKFSLSSMLQF